MNESVTQPWGRALVSVARGAQSLVWDRCLGRSLALERLLASTDAARLGLKDDRSIDQARVFRWGPWSAHSWGFGGGDPDVLWGWESRNGEYRQCQRSTPLAGLTATTTLMNHRCDIRDVDGLAVSKSRLDVHDSLDDFAESRCTWLLGSITVDAVNRALAHHEVRIMRGQDAFTQYGWDGRLFLSNAGGSHHFAGARWLAGQLNHRVPLCGPLDVVRLVPEAVDAVCTGFDIFTSPCTRDALHSAMEASGATYFVRSLPAPHSDIDAVFLPKDVPKSQRAARLFREAGVFDLAAHLRSQMDHQMVLQNAGRIPGHEPADDLAAPRP